MRFSILKERVYDLKDKSRTGDLVDKISSLTNSGKDETAEMQQTLKNFSLALKSEDYSLPKTIDTFKTQMLGALTNMSDKEYLEFMKNVSEGTNLLKISNIDTN